MIGTGLREPMAAVIGRRAVLLSGAAVAGLAGCAHATAVSGSLPWEPNSGSPPVPIRPGPWTYFTPEEGSAVEAVFDRLIPPDPQWPGAKDVGCAVFIDRQLAGPYGAAQGLYMQPPFHHGTPEQGFQGPLTPAQTYRRELAALDSHCQAAFAGKTFRALGPQQQDALLTAMEKGQLAPLSGGGRAFFALLWKNAREGFFADPVYGGNRDMAGWRMIGFPGARYDYRDWVTRHNETYPLPPVGITGRPAWSAKT